MAELSEYKLHPGDPAPSFSLPGVGGKTYRLADWANTPFLVVAFWCNHCPYVQAWEGRMLDLARTYGPKGVQVVLINANDAVAYPDDSFESMERRAHEKGYTVPYLRDDSQEVARAYGALVTPHPMLFGKDRRLLFQGKIDDNHQRPDQVHHRYLEVAVQQALAGTPVAPSQLPVVGCTVKWRS